jgi:hypothetical protein
VVVEVVVGGMVVVVVVDAVVVEVVVTVVVVEVVTAAGETGGGSPPDDAEQAVGMRRIPIRTNARNPDARDMTVSPPGNATHPPEAPGMGPPRPTTGRLPTATPHITAHREP